jgi:itaconate CoA-transferase
VPFLQFAYGNGIPPRLGLNHPSIAPYGAYPCGDGGEVVIAIQNQREWARLCGQVLDDAGMADDPLFADNLARVANRPALNARIDAVFGRLTRAEVVARLGAAQIAYGAVNTVADFAEHPQLRRSTVATESGPVDIAAPPVRIGGAAPALRPVPALGAHNEAIRAEFAA